MPNEPSWLPLEEVIELNRDLVADTTEPHGIIKGSDLESGCYRPIRHWEYDGEGDMVILAVKLLYGIANSHGFIQGNKRTGLLAALMFLRINGWELDPSLDSDEFGEVVLDLLNGGMSEADFALFIRDHVFESLDPLPY